MHYIDYFNTWNYDKHIGTTGTSSGMYEFEYAGTNYHATSVEIDSTGNITINGIMDPNKKMAIKNPTLRKKYEIKKVVVNPEKEATTVIFKDGEVEVVKKSLEDPEADIFSVVAYAVAERVYGSNSAFKKEVVNKVEVMKSKENKSDDSKESLTKAFVMWNKKRSMK